MKQIWIISAPQLKDRVLLDGEYAHAEFARLEQGGWQPELKCQLLLTEDLAAVVRTARGYVQANNRVYENASDTTRDQWQALLADTYPDLDLPWAALETAVEALDLL